MAKIKLMNGTHIHVRPSQITMVSGDQSQAKLSGFGPGKLDVQEGAEALLTRLGLTGAFLPYTAPNGTPIWVCREAIALVRAPLEIENGNAVVYVGGEHQALEQDVAKVAADTGL